MADFKEKLLSIFKRRGKGFAKKEKVPTGEITDWKAETKKGLKIAGKVSLRVLSVLLNIVLTIMLIGMIAGIIVGIVFAMYIKDYVNPEVDTSLISQTKSGSTTRIYYMDYETEEDRQVGIGTAVEIENQRQYSSDNSIWAPYFDTTDEEGNLVCGIKNTYLDEAFVSIEDHRYWSHNGVDWLRTGKAVINYFFASDEGVFGGSTITQQLIKNLTEEDEVKIQRKVQEIFRAINLENELSKEQILEMYLNIIYLSNNCYGVQAAANTYFGKDVSELTLVECASLAAIVKNPSLYEPVYHPEKNRERRNDVLYTMLNYGCITQAEFDEATEAELVLNLNGESETVDRAVNSWYTDAVFESVKDALMEEYGYSSYVASMTIYTGGLQIYTPMDPEIQSVLEDVYRNDSEYFPKASGGLQPESSMIIIDPYTGDVLGLVGGRGEKTQNRILNRATQTTRPPGSSIKPLSIYGPALDAGVITYGSVYDDVPVNFGDNPDAPKAYPHNLPDVYKGLTTIQDGVRRSVNTIAVRVLEDLTIDSSFSFMKDKLHVESLIDSETSASGKVVTDKLIAPLALGQMSYGITLQELTAGYSIFVNNGVYSKSRLWTQVLDSDGEVVLNNEPESNIAISEQSASIMTKILGNVVASGTASAVTLKNSVNCAGKTGTSSSDFDRWFVGYTPYFIGGVWFGYDMNQALNDFGANPSVTIWNIIMTKLHQKYIDSANAGGEALKTFETAPGVVTATYCKDSGKLMTDACRADPRGSRAETGYFTNATKPTEECDVHVLVSYCVDGRGVASNECKNTKKVGLINVTSRSFPIQISVDDAQYVWREMPENKQPASYEGYAFFITMLPDKEYVGTSRTGIRQYNCYCATHADWQRWKNPDKYNAGKVTQPPTTAPPVTQPPATETTGETQGGNAPVTTAVTGKTGGDS